MLIELLLRDIDQTHPLEIEEECRELEDAYAEALCDNAGFDALSKIWKRIRELHERMEQALK